MTSHAGHPIDPRMVIERTGHDAWIVLCPLCAYRSKAQTSSGRASAAARQHQCGNQHRRNVRNHERNA